MIEGKRTPASANGNDLSAAARWRARLHGFLRPVDEQKAQVLRERWNSLPAELQTNNQISGRHLTHCGFTLGASYCSFPLLFAEKRELSSHSFAHPSQRADRGESTSSRSGWRIADHRRRCRRCLLESRARRIRARSRAHSCLRGACHHPVMATGSGCPTNSGVYRNARTRSTARR